MSYCINPRCSQRQNLETAAHCQHCGTSLWVGDRYRLVQPLRSLSEPGNAEIFEVEDFKHGSHASAVRKVLKISKKNSSTAVRLLQQEAEALAKLNHPGLPNAELEDNYFTYKIPGRLKPLHCIVMEKVAGENLQDWAKRRELLSQEKALDWLRQLLDILQHLHQHRYLHRDIKPSNIMLRPSGQLVLIDFGTVREVTSTVIERLMGKDVTGMGIFSPGYTAPEQVMGKTVPQSDLYALGRTFVFLLTGEHPLDLDTENRTGQLLWREYAGQVSPALAEWIDYLMAPFFWQRPPNAAFVLQSLRGELTAPPVRRSPTPAPLWLKLLNLGLFSALLVMALLWLQRYQEVRLQEPQEGIIQLN